LANSDYDGDINRVWEDIRENVRLCDRESRLLRAEKHKAWFEEACSELLHERK
jgi:hypothetical protein